MSYKWRMAQYDKYTNLNLERRTKKNTMEKISMILAEPAHCSGTTCSQEEDNLCEISKGDTIEYNIIN